MVKKAKKTVKEVGVVMTVEEARSLVKVEVAALIMNLINLVYALTISGEDWGKKQEDFEKLWERS